MSSVQHLAAQTKIQHKGVELREPRVQIAYAPLFTLGGHHFYIRLSQAAAKHFGVATAELKGFNKLVPAKEITVETVSGPKKVLRPAYSTVVVPQLRRHVKVPKYGNAHYANEKRKHEYFTMSVSGQLTNTEIASGLHALLHTNKPDYFVSTDGRRRYFNAGTKAV